MVHRGQGAVVGEHGGCHASTFWSDKSCVRVAGWAPPYAGGNSVGRSQNERRTAPTLAPPADRLPRGPSDPIRQVPPGYGVMPTHSGGRRQRQRGPSFLSGDGPTPFIGRMWTDRRELLRAYGQMTQCEVGVVGLCLNVDPGSVPAFLSRNKAARRILEVDPSCRICFGPNRSWCQRRGLVWFPLVNPPPQAGPFTPDIFTEISHGPGEAVL